MVAAAASPGAPPGRRGSPGPDGAAVLALYGRCKALTLAAAGGLLLGQEQDPSLRAQALALADEVLATQASTSDERIHLDRVRDAALALADLIEDRGSAALDRALTAQKQLRAELGSLLAPQFSPCGAHPHEAHQHLQEAHSA